MQRLFGERVSQARESLGLSVADAARGIMICEEWSEMERGHRSPTTYLLWQIWLRLRFDLTWAITGAPMPLETGAHPQMQATARR